MNKYDKQTFTRKVFGLECEITGHLDEDERSTWFEVTKITHKGDELKDLPDEIYELIDSEIRA